VRKLACFCFVRKFILLIQSIPSASRGEIGTIVVVVGFGFMLLSTLLLTLQSNNNTQVTIQSRANANCAEVQNVSYSPSPISSGGVISCNGQINQAHSGSYTVACGWSKNGGWPQNGGLWQGATCNGVNCNFQIRMDQYTQGTADRYELVMFDMKEECGPATGKRIDMSLASSTQPTHTPTPPPQQPTPTPTSGVPNNPTPTRPADPTFTLIPANSVAPTSTGTPPPTRTQTPTPTSTIRPTATPTCPPNKFRCGSACYPLGEDCNVTNTPTARPTSTPTKTPIPTNTPTGLVTPLPTSPNSTPTIPPSPTQSTTPITVTPSIAPPTPTIPIPTPTNITYASPTPFPECMPLSTNGSYTNKLDIVFIPAAYSSKDEFIADANKSVNLVKQTNLGRTRLMKMNFTAFTDISIDYDFEYLDDKPREIKNKKLARENASKCAGDVTFVLVSKDYFRAFAHIGGMYLEITKDFIIQSSPAHELGHAVASFWDEYPFLDKNNKPINSSATDTVKINCFKKELFPIFIDSSVPCPGWEEYSDAKCIQTCGFGDWYRSTSHSVMNGVGNVPEDFIFNQVSLEGWDKAMEGYK